MAAGRPHLTGAIAQMDEYGIEKTLIATYPLEESIAAVERWPERLLGAAWVNPMEGEKAVREARDAIKNHGFKAVKLHPLFHAYLPNEAAVFPVGTGERSHRSRPAGPVP
ncbi:amidohydrolase family protein [Gehongia tenuis]|uniref:Amidohydrolase family protein n=1 Tax=Gehongia tenuis TaxID=2763655 RepID=A0A926HNH0_9FIRM|nr:amidohydrolase family protein [Gehongia tenuis]MBC8530599.1 amidohydrolase family protein [Gehongia tenuis]